MELNRPLRLSAAAVLAALLTLPASCGHDPDPATSATPTAPRTSSTPARPGTDSRTTEDQQKTDTATKSPTTPRQTGQAGTGRPKVEPGESGTPRAGLPNAAKVNQRNAAAVANAYAETAYTFDTTIDRSANDAQRRAARWLTQDLADSLEGDLPVTTGWDRLKKREAWAKVTVTDVTPDGGDPTKGTTASRLEQVTITTLDKDGDRIGDRQTLTVDLSLTRDSTDDPWRIRDLQTY